jgi:amidase
MSDSYNHVFKQSLNAFNNTLISGGSSGGEGALIGTRGSIVGFGTDIGGSVRIPANLQGLYGLSPSVGRVPMDKSGSRAYIVPAVAGPLAGDLETLEVVMEAMLATEPWRRDPVMVPVGWRRELAAKPERKLKIGFYVDDGAVRCQPPIEAAVRKAAEALREAGHEGIARRTSPSSMTRMLTCCVQYSSGILPPTSPDTTIFGNAACSPTAVVAAVCSARRATSRWWRECSWAEPKMN